jgi:hypothetical protein
MVGTPLSNKGCQILSNVVTSARGLGIRGGGARDLLASGKEPTESRLPRLIGGASQARPSSARERSSAFTKAGFGVSPSRSFVLPLPLLVALPGSEKAEAGEAELRLLDSISSLPRCGEGVASRGGSDEILEIIGDCGTE